MGKGWAAALPLDLFAEVVTPRQALILGRIANGETLRDIGEALDISGQRVRDIAKAAILAIGRSPVVDDLPFASRSKARLKVALRAARRRLHGARHRLRWLPPEDPGTVAQDLIDWLKREVERP